MLRTTSSLVIFLIQFLKSYFTTIFFFTIYFFYEDIFLSFLKCPQHYLLNSFRWLIALNKYAKETLNDRSTGESVHLFLDIAYSCGEWKNLGTDFELSNRAILCHVENILNYCSIFKF